MKAFALIALVLCLSAVSAAQWAVLISGSNGFYNYRHQADVCHAYQTLIKKGIPADNIITLSYDDVANSRSNPFPGKLYNRPNGEDVYAGCKVDYKGEDVTIDNFIGVITGNSTATNGKRVLNSTEEDSVFINFVDHGATGLIAVIDEYLYADQLVNALKTAHKNKLYKKLVFYLEACESGSMFKNLPTDINIYAVTAANAIESSWGCYCPPNDVVNGRSLGSCLGDTFSVVWMENTDANDLSKKTLHDQWNELLPLVNQSHPQQFGDLTWIEEPLSNYLGDADAKKTLTSVNAIPVISGQENSRNIKLITAKAAYERNPTDETFEAYRAEIRSIEYFNHVFHSLDNTLGHSAGLLQDLHVELPEELSCLRTAVSSFERICTKFSDYGLKYTKNLAHLCYTHEITEFDAIFEKICKSEDSLMMISA